MQAEEEGRYDSEGFFTIDVALQVAKTASYKSDDPGLPLLLLVRAAVRAGAGEVAFEFSRSRVSLGFASDKPLSELDPQHLGCRDEQSPPGVLREAISILLGQGHKRVSWSCRGPDGSRGFQHLEGYSQSFSSVEETSSRSVYKLLLEGLPFQLVSPSARMHATVTTRCAFAPLQLVVDSQPIRSRWEPEASGSWHSRLSEGFRVAQVYLSASNPNANAISLPVSRSELFRPAGDFWCQKESFLPHAGPWMTGFERDGSRLDSFPEQSLRCQGAITIPLTMQGADSITFVHQGVALDPVILFDDGFGFEVVWDGSDLPLDSSGLAAIQDDRLQARMRSVRARLAVLFERLAHDMSVVPVVKNATLATPAELAKTGIASIVSRFFQRKPTFAKREGSRLKVTDLSPTSSAVRTVTNSTRERLRYASILYGR